MLRRVLLSLALVFCAALRLQAQADSLSRPVERRAVLYSQVLKETQLYWLSLPEGFEQHKQDCYLLLLLDGDEYFGFAKDIVDLYQTAERIHPTVIVALPSTIKSRWKYYTPTAIKPKKGLNTEDSLLYASSGAFPQYADFIATELLPALEKELAVRFAAKTIFGHSLGGLAAASFLTEKQGVFDHYVLASPSLIWDGYSIVRKVQQSSPESYRFQSTLLTIAQNDLGGYHDGYKYMGKYLRKALQGEKAKLKTKQYEGESHTTSGLKTLFDGLLIAHQKK